MTICAANRECVAADRRFTCSIAYFHASKLWRYKGAIYTSCGDQNDWLRFQKFVKGELKEPPDLDDKEGFSALRLDRRGIWYYGSSYYPTLIDENFYAIGSPDIAAICLMAPPVSMTPEQAVAHICELADGCGGNVEVMWLKD